MSELEADVSKEPVTDGTENEAENDAEERIEAMVEIPQAQDFCLESITLCFS